MLSILRWSSGLGPRLKQWGSDRSTDQQAGERLLEEHDFPAAELYLAQALVECERRQEPSAKRVLLRLELAEAQRHQLNKLAPAEQTAREALDLARRSADRELQLQCLDALGTILALSDHTHEVEKLSREASELEGKQKQRDPLQSARRLHRLGTLRKRTGNLPGAVDALAEVVAIYEKVHGQNHAETARGYSELGAVYRAVANHSEAQRCLKIALRTHEAVCGLESAEANEDLKQLTDSFEEAGDVAGAAQQWERSLMLKQRIVGGNMDAIAQMQADLARTYTRWRNYSRARELLMEAVGTFKRTGGARLALAYEALAAVEEASGHFPQALAELTCAGKVWELVQSDHAQGWASNLERRAALFDLLRQPKEAAFLRDKLAALRQADRWAAAG
jgi:tetratricopeptide (TPR) repeat protein